MWFLVLIFSAGALICATNVAQSRNPVYAVMNLVLLFCNAAGLLLLQGMEFFAILQIIVYIGALSVMFLFVVMLLNISLTEIMSYQRATYYTVAQSLLLWVLCIALLWPALSAGTLTSLNGQTSSMSEGLSHLFKSSAINTLDYQQSYAYQPSDVMLREVGVKLYLEYADLLIMASLILLVAMIGAVILALKKQPKIAPQHNRDFRLIVHTIVSH
jgi:NADH:ubiquinone oxidoreductase subunit 6 (subunit J)